MSVLFVTSEVTKQWDCPQSQQSKAGKGVHGQSHGQAPKQQQQQQQSTSGPAQYTRSKATGMAPAYATPTAGASGHKTASKAVVTGIEPAAPAASTQKDGDYVYIRVPREKVAPVDTGETVQHHVSQSAGSQNAAPVLQIVPVQLPAPASQQCLGHSGTISYTRVSVLQPGGSGDTSEDTVATEPHLEALTQHVAGRLAFPVCPRLLR